MISRAQQPLGASEHQIAVHLIHAHAVRRVVDGSDGRARLPAEGQEVQTESLGKAAAQQHPSDAVPAAVQQWRVHPDTQLPRQHRGDTAADAALGGHTDLAHPITGAVVHTAGDHHAQRALHHLRVGDSTTGLRVDTAARQSRRHPGQIHTGDFQ